MGVILYAHRGGIKMEPTIGQVVFAALLTAIIAACLGTKTEP